MTMKMKQITEALAHGGTGYSTTLRSLVAPVSDFINDLARDQDAWDLEEIESHKTDVWD
jgi:hypothetical protein